MILKVIGGIVIVFGLADLIGSFAGFDLWGEGIGLALPEVLWRFTAWIEIAIGYGLIRAGAALDGESAGPAQ